MKRKEKMTVLVTDANSENLIKLFEQRTGWAKGRAGNHMIDLAARILRLRPVEDIRFAESKPT